MQQVQIQDKNNQVHHWSIYEQTEISYRIFCNGYITEIYKSKCYAQDGELYSSEIRNIEFNDLNWGKSCFCWIRLEE